MAKKVIITLEVNASSLYPIEAPSSAEVEGNCSIYDNNKGSSQNGTVEDFISNVYLNKDVRWQGRLRDPNGADEGYSVSIDAITYIPEDNSKNEKNFFKSDTISGSGGRIGKVTAKVKDDKKLVNKTDVYRIYFRIHPRTQGGQPKSYYIDPKLNGNN